MRGIRLRCWLPVANLAIDAALLGMMAWSVHGRASRQAPVGSIRPVAFLQEGQAAVGWDIRGTSPPPRVRLIIIGTLPAGVVSAGALPFWSWPAGSVRWALLHEGLAIVVWFGIGWLAESPPRRTWVLRFLVLRAVSVLASLSGISMGFCALAILLAWIAAGVWLLGWGLRSGIRALLTPSGAR